MLVPEPTALAVRYHQTGDYLWMFARFWDVAVPLALLLTGASARLRGFSRKIGRGWFGTIGVYVVLFLLVIYLAELPLKFYSGYLRQHAYGLSRQTLGKWFGDSLKTLAVDMIGGFCFAWVPFLILRRYPRWWWLIVSALMMPFMAFVAMVSPVWIDPLFNEFGPMHNQALERKILALAERAGISGSRVFEVNKSVDTKTANAYVTGLGSTKRIVLWDTLLADLDDHEVLAVMGHEMGHYVLNHVARGILLSSLLVVAGLFWTDRAGRWVIKRYGGRLGFDSLADIAAAPLLLLLIGVSATVLGPVALAYSRQIEHEADRFALDLTRMNHAAAHAFATLQRDNLGIPRPSLVYRIWRASHPSMADRIEFCNNYHPWETPAMTP